MSVYVQVVGRLGSDAEIKNGKNGQFVTFRMATDEFKNGKNETAWLNVMDASDRALKMAQYLKKGTMVNIHGVETCDVYQNRNSEYQVSRDIRADRVDFVNSGQSASTQSSDAQVAKSQVTSEANKADCGVLKPPTTSKTAVVEDPSDDLPF